MDLEPKNLIKKATTTNQVPKSAFFSCLYQFIIKKRKKRKRKKREKEEKREREKREEKVQNSNLTNLLSKLAYQIAYCNTENCAPLSILLCIYATEHEACLMLSFALQLVYGVSIIIIHVCILIIFCCSSIGFICISIQAFVISGLVITLSAPDSFLSVVLPPNNSITASTPLIRARCQISDHGRILFILLIAFMGSHARCHPPPPTSSILLIRSIRRVYSSLDRATSPYYTPTHSLISSIAQN